MSQLCKENEQTLHGCTYGSSRQIEKEVCHVRHYQKLVSTVCVIIAFLSVGPSIFAATAIAPTGTVSDLLSTALFVAGSARAGGILESYPGSHAVLLVREGGALTLLASAALEKRLRIEDEWRGRLASVEFTLP